MSTRVLNSSLITLDAAGSASETYAAIRGGLAEDLLWYDEVTLVTSAFWELKYLLRWMSVDDIIYLVQRGALTFVRVPAVLGYASASGLRRIGSNVTPGLNVFRSLGDHRRRNSPHPDDWREQMARMLREDAHMGQHRADQVIQSIEGGVTDVTDAEGDLQTAIAGAWSDMDDIELRGLVTKDPNQDLRNLPEGDPARQRLLRIAVANHNLLLLSLTQSQHLHADPVLAPVLRAKLRRLLPHDVWNDGLTHLLELKRLPSVADAVNTGHMKFTDVIRVRETKNAELFRNWLATAGIGDDWDDVVGSYIAAIESSGQPPAKTRAIRFLLGQVAENVAAFAAAAIAGPAAAIPAALTVEAIDTFLFEGLGRGWSPKAFLDDDLAELLTPLGEVD